MRRLGTTAGTVVDFGCGNGRDALFFANNGLPVLALDRSHEAVAIVRGEALHRQLDLTALSVDLCRQADRATVVRHARRLGAPALCYGRFLFHSLPSTCAEALLREVSRALPATRWALEFRTTADRALPKVLSHRRRFVSLPDILDLARGLDYRVEYCVEGRGLAPFGPEDPVVARLLLSGPDSAEALTPVSQ